MRLTVNSGRATELPSSATSSRKGKSILLLTGAVLGTLYLTFPAAAQGCSDPPCGSPPPKSSPP
jgi:hypothetical protein